MGNSLGGAALLAGLAASACSGNPQTPPRPEPRSQPASAISPPARVSTQKVEAAPPTPNWFAVDSAGHTLTLSLETTAGTNSSSALINGYRSGEARVVVPVGWTVKWSWRNADSSFSHSLVVMTQREKIPLEGGRPSFSNAMSRDVTAGTAVGQTDRTTFETDEAGWYWLLCGVPSHALNGEWIELRVDPEAKAPALSIKARSPG
jgi:plastocyanin